MPRRGRMKLHGLLESSFITSVQRYTVQNAKQMQRAPRPKINRETIYDSSKRCSSPPPGSDDRIDTCSSRICCNGRLEVDAIYDRCYTTSGVGRSYTFGLSPSSPRWAILQVVAPHGLRPWGYAVNPCVRGEDHTWIHTIHQVQCTPGAAGERQG